MPTLPELSQFDSGVNELQTTDLVLGGPSGPANAGPINLTNRTRWLYDQNALNVLAIASINTHLSTLDGQVSTINGQITSINANLSSINGQLPLLAPLANPSFTGAPTAPTPGSFVANGLLATTAYVFNWFAPKASPILTGTPSAPTAAIGTSDAQLATTAFANPGNLLGQTGYYKLPGGLIIQWGQLAKTNTGQTQDATVTFPIAFPAGCFQVFVSSARTVAANGQALNGSGFSNNYSTTGCTIVVDDGSGGVTTGRWVAFGF